MSMDPAHRATPAGSICVRSAGGSTAIISGAFPYEATARLAVARETIQAGAFVDRIDDPEAEIHMLIGHDPGRPVASRRAGSLIVADAADALRVTATVDTTITWIADLVAAIRAGLIAGLSPGFRPTKIERGRDGRGDPIQRVTRAELIEVSAVATPAYEAATVEARGRSHARRPQRRIPL